MKGKWVIRVTAMAVFGFCAITLMSWAADTLAAIAAGGSSFRATQSGSCTVTLSTQAVKLAGDESLGSVSVTANQGCQWTATSNQGWLQITSGVSGNGNGTVSYRAYLNIGPPRTGVISVGGSSYTVTQDCGYFVTSGGRLSAAAYTHSVSVVTGATCPWTAVSNASWISIVSSSQGTGMGEVKFAVPENTGPERFGTITIAGKTYSVWQVSGCKFTLNAFTGNFLPAGGAGSFEVQTNTGCAWKISDANPSNSWITVNSAAANSGSSMVRFTVAANTTGQPRQGNIFIDSLVDRIAYSVSQPSICAFKLTPMSLSASPAATTGSFDLVAESSCPWTAVSTASWLTISGNASGVGTGKINYVVAANTTTAVRTTVIKVGGVDFTITQQKTAGCTYDVSLSQQTVFSLGGETYASVSAPAGCAWTATSNQSWATIRSGASGAGNGSVAITIAANTQPVERQATLSIAGRAFTVTQQVVCHVVSLSSNSFRASAAAGSTTVDVVTDPAGCFFAPFPDSDSGYWVSASGYGTSRITINFLENNGFERVSQATFNNQIFTLTQAAKPVNCAGAFFAPTTQSAAYPGSTYQVDVSTGIDCRWEATTAAPWIVLEAGTTRGIRRGTLIYRVATNPTAQSRTGIIQVNGQSFTVTQAAAPACTSSVTPTSANVAASGGTTTFNVSVGAGCSWSASSSEMAAKVMTGGTGTGNGTVTVVTQPNLATTARTIRLLIAGQTVTLTQAGGATGNPVPLLLRLALKERTNPYKLSVFGTNFVSNSVVRWNGVARATTFVSNTELEITITQGEYNADTTAQINVFNPAPGGGLSNTVNFRNAGWAVGVSAAGYNVIGGVTANSIVAIFGNEFTASTVIARTVPLPNTLGGVMILLYDRDGRRFPMPLFFASPYQLNALVPADIATGLAEMVITCSDGSTRAGYFTVQKVSPGIFTFDATGSGIVAGQALRVRNGVAAYEPVARYNTTTTTFEAIPIDMGPASDQVYLVLYGTGVRHRGDLRNVQCFIGGTSAGSGTEVSVLYLGAQGSLAGLDQTNLLLPRSLAGRGLVTLWLKVDGQWANPVEVNIK